ILGEEDRPEQDHGRRLPTANLRRHQRTRPTGRPWPPNEEIPLDERHDESAMKHSGELFNFGKGILAQVMRHVPVVGKQTDLRVARSSSNNTPTPIQILLKYTYVLYK